MDSLPIISGYIAASLLGISFASADISTDIHPREEVRVAAAQKATADFLSKKLSPASIIPL